MIVYHGSNHNFKTLRIDRKLSRAIEDLSEGEGIYFSTVKSVAECYGKYLYILELNDKYILDFTKRTTITKFIHNLRRYIYDQTKIDINEYLEKDLNTLIIGLQYEKCKICEIDREIKLRLDNNERYWSRVSESTMAKVDRACKKFVKETLKVYVYNSDIKGGGVIKNVSPEIVQIRRKDRVRH